MTLPDSITMFRDLGAVGVVCVSFIYVLRHLLTRQSEQIVKLTDSFASYCQQQSESLRRVTSSMTFLARSIVGLEEIVLTNTDLWRSLDQATKDGTPLNDVQRLGLDSLRRIESCLTRQQEELGRIAAEMRNEK